MFRAVWLSFGGFTAGVAIEKRFNIYADVVRNKFEDNLVVSENSGGDDVVDGGYLAKVPGPQGESPEIDVSSSSSTTSIIAKHGFPSFDSLRSYKNFVISYDRRTRVANWVMEHLTPHHLKSDDYNRDGIEFVQDKSFHHYFRATNDDYRNSGYDRGHLAAAGNYRHSADHVKETFILTNVAPQVGRGFNRDKWNELEQYCRKIVRQSEHTWICTGPLYLPRREPENGKLFVKYEVIGKNHISVPTHFFKIILYQQQQSGQYRMESYLVPNEPIHNNRDLGEFRIDPEVIERAAGLIFFSNLPRKQIQINQQNYKRSIPSN